MQQLLATKVYDGKHSLLELDVWFSRVVPRPRRPYCWD